MEENIGSFYKNVPMRLYCRFRGEVLGEEMEPHKKFGSEERYNLVKQKCLTNILAYMY